MKSLESIINNKWEIKIGNYLQIQFNSNNITNIILNNRVRTHHNNISLNSSSQQHGKQDLNFNSSLSINSNHNMVKHIACSITQTNHLQLQSKMSFQGM